MPLPPLDDFAHWWRIIQAAEWDGIRNEDLVAAFLADGAGCPRRIANGVAERLIKEARRFVRRRVSRTIHPNQGRDIVEDVLHVAMMALLTPDGPGARALAGSFKGSLHFATLAAVRRSLRGARAVPLDERSHGCLAAEPTDPAEGAALRKVLDAIRDPVHRAILEDRLQGYTYAQIAERNGCSETTARTVVKALSARTPPPTEKDDAA